MRLALVCALLAAAVSAGAESKRVVFDGAAEHVFALKDLDPKLPADWSGYEFLVLELRLSSPQRFDLRIHNANGVRSVRLAPVSGAWIRAAVPLGFLTHAASQGGDLAAVHNKARPMIFINLSGTPGELNAVRQIGVAMATPVGGPSLEIRSVRLSKTDPGDALLDAQPMVDEFGQWIHDDWPGKAKNLEQLKAAWTAEVEELKWANPVYCSFGGFRATKSKPTGYFHVVKVEGRWWIVDPDGHFFFSTGVDSIGTSVTTATAGREALFAALPPAAQAPAGRGGSSFYAWNLARRFGPEWTAKWVDFALDRMFAWGFNTVGNWSDPRLASVKRMPYVFTSRGWGAVGPMGVPDVYAPDFAATVERSAAEQCDSRRNDSYLVGYFLGNEPPWPGRESVAVDAILAGAATPLQKELKSFLAGGDTQERRRQFLIETYRKYVDTVSAAIRRHDSNHLNLGLRFGSSAPPEIVSASKVFDVYSLNSYAYSVNQGEIGKVRELIDKPVLIGEFHFGTPGRGMTPGLKQVTSQEERGVAYRYYVENAAADASIVGAHWFEWVDEPSTGRFDGENYNIGLIDVTDRPYKELVEAARATHLRLLEVHSGKEPPVTRQAKVQ